MKIEGWLFALGAAFFIPLSAVYWWFSRDPVGTTALALSGGLAVIVGFYVLFTAKRVYPRPEDRMDGEIDQADPEYGFFSPHSWWPLFIGLGAFIIALGLIFAVWVIVLGVTALLMALVGWLFEYYRGEFAK
ncbi:MAG: cytochrome c oxidase subunit 4 [Candidatus Nanopelagicales bacterium]|nr:cytochrome c oxidase subunit 4 [Candidatus Nanopelagicales bacterium]MCF8538169.1 cytochrome c oxidase subunit 4 [Candidatus Nanopelagicales bacterium]MCF8557806.1 cytochrome c oxidase subunit 4 [Candidatus Nanopelagicales bacterium]